jgi:hypothetical protein
MVKTAQQPLQAAILPEYGRLKRLTQNPSQLVQAHVTTTTIAEHQMKTARHILLATATHLLYYLYSVKRVGCWKGAASAWTQTVLDVARTKKSPL